MCYLFDVFPTLGALCGVKAPVQSEGIDFSRALLNAGESARSSLRFAYKDVQQAACDNEWKLIYYPKIQRTQLFNLKEDPAEIRDLSESPGNSQKIEQLRRLLMRDE